jgi:hypothetical protein
VGAITPASPLPGSQRAPQVPIPLDELLKLAGEFLDGGRLREAETLLDHIVSSAPDAAAALHLTGILLYRTNRYHAAAEVMERAITLAPNATVLYRDLCPIYERIGRYDDAIRVAHRALDVDQHDLQSLHNLAFVHHRRLDLDNSIASARRALALDPSAPGPHFQLAETLLLRGAFAEGWDEYEWRFRIPGAPPPLPPTSRPQWDGAPMPGKTLLLVADQGFGDAIQFSRYIPWVCERCPDVVVAADPIMHPLIRQTSPVVKLVERWDQCPPFTAYCPLSGLPRLHGTTLETIPASVPYLSADPVRAAAWRVRLQELIPANAHRIGIAWAGRPTHNNDANRSAGLAAFGPLAGLNNVALVSLQKGPGQDAVAGYFHRAPLLNMGAAIADFVDMMAIIEALDLVVTVDTAVAHLAGAMAKPVWIMLPYAPDWRWLLDRSDSPWYPTARLFRQSKAGDWRSVGRDVCEAVRLSYRLDDVYGRG